jgi:hypothetical protein
MDAGETGAAGIRRLRMKAYTHYLTMNVPGKMSFVNITGEVAVCVRKSGVQEGLCLVNNTSTKKSLFFIFLLDFGWGAHYPPPLVSLTHSSLSPAPNGAAGGAPIAVRVG